MLCQYLRCQGIGQLVLLFNVLGSLLILQQNHSLMPVLYLSV
uniref:Transmembrane protein n=1 Tax=Medicago truncatula TaxID=3880 RepID=I3T5Q0_MEDTR|nr:unknown [Medicago truncatula]